VIRRILKPVASLKLTVIIFALSLFLIFAGTLAQVHEGVWTVVDEYFRSAIVVIEFQLFVPESIAKVGGAFVFPGGLTLGIVMFVNLIAAHAVRFKLKMNRVGIILTHLGVILLLVGEFVTGFAAEEGNMTIREGESANYVEDIRTAELAVVDPSDPDEDYVVVVPESLLAAGPKVTTHELLPFSFQVAQWLPNSRIFAPDQAPLGWGGLADAGAASSLSAAPFPLATGVDGQNADVPSAYITFFQGEKNLGTYLLSVHIPQPQLVEVDGRAFWLTLRFKRTYRPYTLHLIDFKHDLFTGTQKARNFSSQVRLVDPGRNIDREILIYMNNPLRHAGETFYQASFLQNDEGTVLQVVKNPGWLIPYVSCTLVSVGMLWHFGLRLIPALRRRPR